MAMLSGSIPPHERLSMLRLASAELEALEHQLDHAEGHDNPHSEEMEHVQGQIDQVRAKLISLHTASTSPQRAGHSTQQAAFDKQAQKKRVQAAAEQARVEQQLEDQAVMTAVVKAKNQLQIEDLREQLQEKISRVSELERQVAELQAYHEQTTQCHSKASEKQCANLVAFQEGATKLQHKYTKLEDDNNHKTAALNAKLEKKRAKILALEKTINANTKEHEHTAAINVRLEAAIQRQRDRVEKAERQQQKDAEECTKLRALLQASQNELKLLQDSSNTVDTELARQKEMIQSGLWKMPMEDADEVEAVPEEDLSWFRNQVSKIASGSHPEGLKQVRQFETQVSAAQSATELIEILIDQHRQEKAETSNRTIRLMNDMRCQLTMEASHAKETEAKMAELELILGQKRIAAHNLIRRRINRYRLEKSLKNLMAGQDLKKRIEHMNEAESVVKEMHFIAEKFEKNLGVMLDLFLVPIRANYLVPEASTSADPHGWILYDFDRFCKSLQTLRDVHKGLLPKMVQSLDSPESKLAAVSEFYMGVVEASTGPLVQYMNRISFLMKLLKNKKTTKSMTGVPFQDMIWNIQSSLPSPLNKQPLDFYLFGVLQTATNIENMLKRVIKLTPDSEVNIERLHEALDAVEKMNIDVDKQCGDYKMLNKMQETLHQPMENYVTENRHVQMIGDLHCLGRVADSEVQGASGGRLESIESRLTEPCHLILLNDMLLMTEPIAISTSNPRYRGPKGRQPAKCTIIKYLVRRVLRKPTDHSSCYVLSHPGNVFAVNSGMQGLFLFKASDVAAKTKWMDNFIEGWKTNVVDSLG